MLIEMIGQKGKIGNIKVTCWGKSPLSICALINIFAALCKGVGSLSAYKYQYKYILAMNINN